MRWISIISVFVALAAGCNPSHAQNHPSPPATPGESVVVLELYTSQGCSSCPPADKVLSDLGNDPALRDKVLPLSFHVDYWDYIGWKDPFASSRWSDRQRRYGKQAFDTRRIYTPQLIINGREHIVGSRGSDARSRLTRASKLAAQVEIKAAAVQTASAIDVTAEFEVSQGAGKLDIIFVVYENGLTTRVSRGENTGRKLKNDFVVRQVTRGGNLESKPGTRKKISKRIELDKSWKASNLGVGVIVQHPDSMSIAGARRVTIKR